MFIDKALTYCLNAYSTDSDMFYPVQEIIMFYVLISVFQGKGDVFTYWLIGENQQKRFRRLESVYSNCSGSSPWVNSLINNNSYNDNIQRQMIHDAGSADQDTGSLNDGTDERLISSDNALHNPSNLSAKQNINSPNDSCPVEMTSASTKALPLCNGSKYNYRNSENESKAELRPLLTRDV